MMGRPRRLRRAPRPPIALGSVNIFSLMSNCRTAPPRTRFGRQPFPSLAGDRDGRLTRVPERSPMPTFYRTPAAFALMLALAPAAPASAVRLGALFGDHMVVQRDRPLRVWGDAAPGARIDVRFGPRRAAATAGP